MKDRRRKEHRVNYQAVSITQYDIKGTRIAYYPSLTNTEEATRIRAEHIGLVARGINKSANGYFWKKGMVKKKLIFLIIDRDWVQEQPCNQKK